MSEDAVYSMSEDAVCVAFNRDGCIAGAFFSPGHTNVGKCVWTQRQAAEAARWAVPAGEAWKLSS